MRLRDFTRGYSQNGKRHCEKPWKISKHGVVTASNGAILLIRKAKKKDKYEEMPEDHVKSFERYVVHKPSKEAKKINIAKLRRFSGKGVLDSKWDNYFRMKPGILLGKRFNLNYLALALKIVEESEMLAELDEGSTGYFLILTGKEWRIILMEVKVTNPELDAKKKQPPVFV